MRGFASGALAFPVDSGPPAGTPTHRCGAHVVGVPTGGSESSPKPQNLFITRFLPSPILHTPSIPAHRPGPQLTAFAHKSFQGGAFRKCLEWSAALRRNPEHGAEDVERAAARPG